MIESCKRIPSPFKEGTLIINKATIRCYPAKSYEDIFNGNGSDTNTFKDETVFLYLKTILVEQDWGDKKNNIPVMILLHDKQQYMALFFPGADENYMELMNDLFGQA